MRTNDLIGVGDLDRISGQQTAFRLPHKHRQGVYVQPDSVTLRKHGFHRRRTAAAHRVGDKASLRNLRDIDKGAYQAGGKTSPDTHRFHAGRTARRGDWEAIRHIEADKPLICSSATPLRTTLMVASRNACAVRMRWPWLTLSQ